MALLIEKNISKILGTLDVSTLYIRLQSHLKYSGKELSVYTKTYLNKDSYLSDINNTNILVPEIPSKINFPYDRETDGVDILLVSHNKFMDYLSKDKTIVTSFIDTSTGEILYKEDIITPKFCESSEISIIDI